MVDGFATTQSASTTVAARPWFSTQLPLPIWASTLSTAVELYLPIMLQVSLLCSGGSSLIRACVQPTVFTAVHQSESVEAEVVGHP